MITKTLTFLYQNSLEGQITAPYVLSAPGQEAIVSEEHGTITKRFAARVYDVRWAARRFMRMVHRHGIPCFYYEAFYNDPAQFDKFTGSRRVSGVMAEQNFSTGTAEEKPNREIGYFLPRLIKCLQPNYEAQASKEELGNIYIEEGIITVPAYWMFHRWDILRVQDKNWVVTQEPKLIYDNKGYVEGFELVCRSLRTGIIGF
jgi:hypothetical protein